jgi:hypothetical protein
LPQIVTIDGRGITIQEAIRDMRARMGPLEERGFHPVSEVEIVDTSTKKIIQTFPVVESGIPDHLEPDPHKKGPEPDDQRLHQHPHVPETKEHYPYIARIRLEE